MNVAEGTNLKQRNTWKMYKMKERGLLARKAFAVEFSTTTKKVKKFLGVIKDIFKIKNESKKYWVVDFWVALNFLCQP